MPKIYFSQAYAGKVEVSVYIEDKKHIIDKDWLCEYLQKNMQKKWLYNITIKTPKIS